MVRKIPPPDSGSHQPEEFREASHQAYQHYDDQNDLDEDHANFAPLNTAGKAAHGLISWFLAGLWKDINSIYGKTRHEFPDGSIYEGGLSAEKSGRLILTGSLEQGNVRSSLSNRPGSKPEINQHFLWTLGSDVLSNVDVSEYGKMSGTSMSTPIVTGAAALVFGKHKDFSPEDVKECLLESADREFWVYPEEENPVHVVSPDSPPVRHNKDVTVEQFDPKKWGKGILNVKRALEYASIKSEHKNLTPKEIRERLNKKEFLEQEEAAKPIQKWFRDIRENRSESKQA